MCVVEIASAAAGVVSIAAQIQSAKAEKAAGEYSAKQSMQQAQIAERNAAYERQQGIEDARQKRLNAIQNMGRQKADIAAGNISMSSATAMDVLDYEKSMGELDAINIINDSERKSQSYLDSAQQYYSNASLQSFKTKHKYTNNALNISSNTLSFIGSFK